MLRLQFFQLLAEVSRTKHALMGLMQALELVRRSRKQEAGAAATNALMEEARKRGLLVGKGGFYGNVIRMSPPLNIGKADVDEAARILDESFAALKK